ncbi:MAG: hypothetical protein H7287_04410 [Thermoleophilia bacterium]|nr:hypothetical protein [Thermoleophilia bacterium]
MTKRRRPAGGGGGAQAQAASAARGRAQAAAAGPPTIDHLPLPDVGAVSRATGRFVVDEARARRDANAALARIDFSKRDIMLWVPATDGHAIDSYFQRAHDFATTRAGDVSLSVVDYVSTWELRQSCPTGIATLKLVLAGIRERLGADLRHHDVTIGGMSQGAWIVGEVMADPKYADFVKRAALMGHPWLAAHQYNSGQDRRVRVVNNPDDQVTLPVVGSAADGLDSMAAVHMGRLSSSLALLARTIAKNPIHGWLLAKSYTYTWPLFKGLWQDQHNYDNDMVRGYVYLETGAYVPSQKQFYGSLD